MAFHFSDCQLTYHSAPATWMIRKHQFLPTGDNLPEYHT